MFRLAAIAALLCASVAPAFAEDFDILEGLYSGTSEGSEITATLTHVENGVYSAALSTTVPMQNDSPGCGGSIEGDVVIRDNVGVLTAPNELYDATSTMPAFSKQQCEIKLEFDGDYGLVITEEAGCSYYHGASCSFSGEVLHDAAGI